MGELLTRAEELALGTAIQAASKVRAKLAVGRITAEKAAPILAAGTNAREILILRNEGLVIKVANHYRNQGVDLDDLIQDGFCGLIRAVDKFDPARGTKFSTMATWWIRQAVARGVVAQGQAIKVPQHVYDLRWQCAQASQRLDQQLGRAASVEEVAADMGLDIEDVRRALESFRQPISFEQPKGHGDDNELTLGDTIADRGPGTEALALESIEGQELRKAIAGMVDYPGDQVVIEEVYGIDTPGMIAADLARSLGISRSRVQQRQARGLRMLKHALEHTEAKRERGRS